MDLNNPDIRQQELADRLRFDRPLVASDIAQEFNVSLDTIRRDLIALENTGKARRVRGGAVPVQTPAEHMATKLNGGALPNPALAKRCLPLLEHARTLFLDGGTTVLALAQILPLVPARLIVTPSPFVAAACLKRGHQVHVIGGPVSPSGGIATGDQAEGELQTLLPDVCVLGVCGLDAGMGLTSDIYGEARLKRLAAHNSQTCIVVTAGTKIGRRARYATLAAEKLDHIVTDAPLEALTELASCNIGIHLA